jgi:glyoxylase-like metal-dependent hydrolase (beta-lactamase superfamily II)
VAAIRKISPQPIRFFTNTHVHVDHTGANANFAKMGAVLIAREELRDELLHPPGRGAVANADPARLPMITYGIGDPVKIYMNGETVELIPVRAAHTGGDTMVRFRNADAIMIGDFYRNYGYPFIDTANGGTLDGALKAIDQAIVLAGPDTKLIPGHGTIINRKDLVPYRAMIVDVQSKVSQMIKDGKSLPQVLAAHLTAPYDAKVPGGLLPAGAAGTSADRFVSMVYSELNKAGK